MKRTCLVISLCLNAALAVLLASLARKPAHSSPALFVSQTITQRIVRTETNFAAPAVIEVNAPFHWSQLESTDYRTYIQNLRDIGCPELTIYDIISAEVNELFDGKILALVDSVTHQFWNLAVQPHAMEKMIKEKADELGDLHDQKNEMMKLLFSEKTPADLLAEQQREVDKRSANAKLLDFLPSDKAGQAADLLDDYANRSMALLKTRVNISQSEYDRQSKELAAQRKRDLQTLLTPDEYQEYRLRTEGSAEIRHRLEAFAGTEEDFHKLALAELNKSDKAAIIQSVGPEKFEAYERGKDNDYTQTLRVTERFGLPESTALQIYQMQKEAEARAREVRGDAGRTVEERRALLQAMQLETEKTISATLGTTQFNTYRKYQGAWLERFAADVK
jgi:hypothetical protein